jgi:hypothetical protein
VHRSEADGRGFEATESSLRLMARCLAWRARCLAPKARCMGCMGSCLGGSVGARGRQCRGAVQAVRHVQVPNLQSGGDATETKLPLPEMVYGPMPNYKPYWLLMSGGIL